MIGMGSDGMYFTGNTTIRFTRTKQMSSNGTNVFAIDMLNTASADGYSLTTPNYIKPNQIYNMSGTILFGYNQQQRLVIKEWIMLTLSNVMLT